MYSVPKFIDFKKNISQLKKKHEVQKGRERKKLLETKGARRGDKEKKKSEV